MDKLLRPIYDTKDVSDAELGAAHKLLRMCRNERDGGILLQEVEKISAEPMRIENGEVYFGSEVWKMRQATAEDIAARINRSEKNTTKLIDKLEKLGYMTRFIFTVKKEDGSVVENRGYGIRVDPNTSWGDIFENDKENSYTE